jgi:uncharacterized protein YdhG (YjbR/CyaY superfamily)
MKSKRFSSINEYTKPLPRPIAARIMAIRAIVKKAAPDAVEVISYNMPAFKLNGKILLYFAAFKNHIGVYPYPSGINALAKELASYKTSTSTVQLQHDEPFPIRLIAKLVKFRVTENLARKQSAKARKKMK